MNDPTILLFGFLPFAGHAINPSQMLVDAVLEGTLATPGLRCVGECLPVIFDQALPQASAAIARHRPQAVVALGQSPGTAIHVERIAVNRASFSIPDEAGFQPTDQPIAPGGPAQYQATLPTRQIWEAMIEQGVPATPSDSAGTYLCNALMYHALHLAAQEAQEPYIAGFIHVPLLPQQACDGLREARLEPALSPQSQVRPSMSFALMQRGLQIALDVIRVYLGSRSELTISHTHSRG